MKIKSWDEANKFAEYYNWYINELAKRTGIPRKILEGTEAGDTRL